MVFDPVAHQVALEKAAAIVKKSNRNLKRLLKRVSNPLYKGKCTIDEKKQKKRVYNAQRIAQIRRTIAEQVVIVAAPIKYRRSTRCNISRKDCNEEVDEFRAVRVEVAFEPKLGCNGLRAMETIVLDKSDDRPLFEYLGKVVTNDKGVDLVDAGKGEYLMKNSHSKFSDLIDGSVGGSIARFINHRCKGPNCQARSSEGRIFIYQEAPIEEGEFLSLDYQKTQRTFKCRCGTCNSKKRY